MSKPYTPENLPAEFPTDHTLFIEAETVPGIDVHDRNAMIGMLRRSMEQFKREPSARLWFDCVKWERQLRGIVAEAKINRLRQIKPLHFE